MTASVSMQQRPSLLILGATSTMARAVAHYFARNGWDLVLAAKDARENERNAADIRVRYGVHCGAIPFDALAFENHDKVLEDCQADLGRVPDGVLLCFGYLTDQAEAQQDFGKARRVIDINFTAAVSVLERFAAVFEARHAGFIAALSSVAGDRGRQSNYIYGAAKAGLTAYLQGLRNRLFHAGVHVITIKPGFVDTKMIYGMKVPTLLVATPEKAAADIFRAIQKRKNNAYVPRFWWLIMTIVCALPEPIFKRLKL